MNDPIWQKDAKSPVIRWDDWGTVFDPFILLDESPHARYRLYFSWRPQNAIALVESEDARHWSKPQIVLGAAARSNGGEHNLNRQCVLKHNGIYHMYYSGQERTVSEKHARIFHATSADGVFWQRDNVVLEGEHEWEKFGIMCPHVIFDDEKGIFRMWYSAMNNPGTFYEPDSLGYAESVDALHWYRPVPHPVFKAADVKEFPLIKVTAAQVLKNGGWYYMFYIGFTTESLAKIYLARSRDGVGDWESFPGNPIVSPTPDAWDSDACYKPAVCFDGKQWLLWYNGRRGIPEQIGLAVCQGKKFWN